VKRGFTPYERSSPFFDLIGPLLSRRGQAGPEFALEIDERHVNNRGFAHAGVLSAVADVVLGYTTAFSQDPPVPLLTTSLTIDFAGRVAPGDMLVATVDVQKVGRRIAFANCYLSVEDRRIARASAVFANVS
jgi:acyl-coenzyme A thioesterase PaaI-like protein